jgi:ribosomal protein S18 acetylase RimI-like enzyme
VLKTYYGKSVAQLLLNKAITIAQQNQKTFIWLGVWENNHRAVAFYKKNGFEVFGEHVFKFGNEPQTDVLMRLDVKNI